MQLSDGHCQHFALSSRLLPPSDRLQTFVPVWPPRSKKILIPFHVLSLFQSAVSELCQNVMWVSLVLYQTFPEILGFSVSSLPSCCQHVVTPILSC